MSSHVTMNFVIILFSKITTIILRKMLIHTAFPSPLPLPPPQGTANSFSNNYRSKYSPDINKKADVL